MSSISPIETFYNGINYRSRLEARWATFLTALGIKFHYEYNAYKLPAGSYLPDFFIPTMRQERQPFVPTGVWLEIKPDKQLDPRVSALCSQLAAATERLVWLLQGPVGTQRVRWFGKSGDEGSELLEYFARTLCNEQRVEFDTLRFDHSIHLAKNNRFGT